jgi:hypothetical protein
VFGIGIGLFCGARRFIFAAFKSEPLIQPYLCDCIDRVTGTSDISALYGGTRSMRTLIFVRPC